MLESDAANRRIVVEVMTEPRRRITEEPDTEFAPDGGEEAAADPEAVDETHAARADER